MSREVFILLWSVADACFNAASATLPVRRATSPLAGRALTPNPTSSSPAPAVPRAAASLIVLRDAPRGLEVLMLRRADRPGDQNSGATVFPGGLLDATDRGHYKRCAGLDDLAASTRLGLPEHGLHYWIAAVRECFEEAGLLFAAEGGGELVDLKDFAAAELWQMRRSLHANQTGMAEVCERLGVRLAVGELAYFSHWITPLGMPKIFDTRFFIARAPAGQVARADLTETVELMWLTPAEALGAARSLKLMNVTELTLRQLAGHSSAEAAINAARSQVSVPVTRPRMAMGAKGRVAVNLGDPPFAEIGRLDPAGRGDVGTELLPGRPVWLSPRVLRVTAPNGSIMTGPGTNSYFIGEPGRNDWTLLDPGPDDAVHVQALGDAAPGRVTRILVTHTHKDHSPAAAAMKAATGAITYGRLADHFEWQDKGFVPDHVLRHGERLALGDGVTLRVVATPGHASNHLCYLLEEERLLFTAGIHRGHQPARRQHGGLSGVSAGLAGHRTGLAGAWARFPDRSAARRGAQDHRSPLEARGQGARSGLGVGPGRRGSPACRCVCGHAGIAARSGQPVTACPPAEAARRRRGAVRARWGLASSKCGAMNLER